MVMKDWFSIKDHKSMYLYSMIVGVLSGMFAALFAFCLEAAIKSVSLLTNNHLQKRRFNSDSYSFNIDFNLFYYIFIPAIGAFLSGLVIHRFCPEASGMGADSMIHAFHYKEGNMNSKVPWIKSISTILTLSSGGSGGKEGPISQIGAGLGILVSNIVNAGARARRTLLLAGTAGGLGAIFHAPLGGALTAAEMVYLEDMESDALIPCIISSSTAYLVSESLMPRGTVFKIKSAIGYRMNEIPFYILLGILCYLGGKLFIKMFYYIQSAADRTGYPIFIKSALGGIAVGAISFLFPEIGGTGDTFIQSLLTEQANKPTGGEMYPLILFFSAFFLLKILATSLTVGTGGSAGVFGPSLFAGCMIGGAVARFAEIFPGLEHISHTSFMLVGMGAFYSGIASAPIAGIIMVCEMIGNYKLLPPLMTVTIISFMLSNKFSIYKNQLLNRFSTPAHFWDMNHDIMDKIFLKDVPEEYFRNFAVLKTNTPIRTLEELSNEIQASDFIVVNTDDTYYGFVSLRKIKNFYEAREHLANLIIIKDLADTSVPSASMNSSLKQVFDMLSLNDIDKLAVVNQDQRLIGYLKISDVFSIYFNFIRKK